MSQRPYCVLGIGSLIFKVKNKVSPQNTNMHQYKPTRTTLFLRFLQLRGGPRSQKLVNKTKTNHNKQIQYKDTYRLAATTQTQSYCKINSQTFSTDFKALAASMSMYFVTVLCYWLALHYFTR